MTTKIKEFVLVADKPQRIPGSYTGIRIIQGAYHSFRLFFEDPKTSGELLNSRKLTLDGTLVSRRMRDPWVMAVGQTPGADHPLLQLELLEDPCAQVETQGPVGFTELVLGGEVGQTIAVAGSTQIATTGNMVKNLTPGEQEFHARGWFSGFVSASEPFRVELQVQDSTFNTATVIAAKSRNMVGYHSLMLDLAQWDPTWQKSAPTTFSGTAVAVRLPCPHSVKSRLVMFNTGAGISTYSSYIALRSR